MGIPIFDVKSGIRCVTTIAFAEYMSGVYLSIIITVCSTSVGSKERRWRITILH